MVRITCEKIVNLRAENKEKKITGDQSKIAKFLRKRKSLLYSFPTHPLT